MTLSGATTPGRRGPGSNGNEGLVQIPQISKAGASPPDGWMSYVRTLFGEWYYLSVEMQSMYSTAPADWAW